MTNMQENIVARDCHQTFGIAGLGENAFPLLAEVAAFSLAASAFQFVIDPRTFAGRRSRVTMRPAQSQATSDAQFPR